MHYTMRPPPVPDSPEDQARWSHTALRSRLLSGHWRADLQERVLDVIGIERAQGWGVGIKQYGGVDMTSNILAHLSGQLACLYDQRPQVLHDDAAAAERVQALLDGVGWPSLMQRFQRETLGLREMLMRIDVTEDLAVQLRPVEPHYVVAKASVERPDLPVMVREVRQREDVAKGDWVWTWDEVDLSDPENPSYRVLSEDLKEDLSAVYLGGTYSGKAYPWRDEAGAPVMPYVMYHASRSARLWDPHHGIEIVEGTLQAGVYWSHLAHGLARAAHPQRYMVGVRPAGNLTDGSDGRAQHKIVGDPGTILMFDVDPDSPGQPMIGQFQPGADIGAMTEAVERYERRVSAFAGVDASDILRVSGDPRSGYALSISREGKRDASRKLGPVFEEADQRFLRTLAVMLNSVAGDRSLPESGYTMRYTPLPLSADERRALLDEVQTLLESGFIDRNEAQRRLHSAGLVESPVAVEPQPEQVPAPTTGEPDTGSQASPDDAPAAPTAPAEDVPTDSAAVAFTGIQISSTTDLLRAVQDGTFTRETVVMLLVETLNFTPEKARALVNSIVIRPPTPEPTP